MPRSSLSTEFVLPGHTSVRFPGGLRRSTGHAFSIRPRSTDLATRPIHQRAFSGGSMSCQSVPVPWCTLHPERENADPPKRIGASCAQGSFKVIGPPTFGARAYPTGQLVKSSSSHSIKTRCVNESSRCTPRGQGSHPQCLPQEPGSASPHFPASGCDIAPPCSVKTIGACRRPMRSALEVTNCDLHPASSCGGRTNR